MLTALTEGTKVAFGFLKYVLEPGYASLCDHCCFCLLPAIGYAINFGAGLSEISQNATSGSGSKWRKATAGYHIMM